MLVDVINWANYVINHIITGDQAKKLRACLHEVGKLLGGGGGGNIMGLKYGDVPLFRGTFFPKNVELLVSVFKLCAELLVPF